MLIKPGRLLQVLVLFSQCQAFVDHLKEPMRFSPGAGVLLYCRAHEGKPYLPYFCRST